MRHKASRPSADLWHRLSRAAAHRLGVAAEHFPVRALTALMVAVGLGVGGYLALAPLVGGSSTGDTETAVDSSTPDAERPSLTTEPPASDGRTPGGTRRKPDASAAGNPQAPAPSTSDVTESPSPEAGQPTESPSTEPRPPSTDPSQSGEAAPRRRADTTPPQTSLSEEFPEPDTAVFTLSANEAATFTCSLDGAPYSACDSPTHYADLDPGWHTLAVRATDKTGNADPSPAKTRWRANNGHSGDE